MKKDREGYKITELGEIPEKWRIVTLDNLSEKIGDGLHGTPKYVESSEYYFINGNNLVDGKIQIYEETKMVSEEEYMKNNKDLNSNSLLISLNGTIGNVAFYNNESVMLGKSCGYVNLKSNINKKYIYYVLKSDKILDYFNKELTGTTIKNLSLNNLRNTPIALPDTKEQEKIALILSTVDEQIDNVEGLIQKNKEIKKGLMQRLLTKGIGHTKFKKTEIGEIPEEWEVGILSSLIDEQRRITYGIVQPGEYDKNGKYVIRAKDYSFGWVNNTEIFKCNEEIDKSYARARVKEGDILLTIVGSVGNLAIVPDRLNEANITQQTARLAFDSSKANNIFYYNYLKSDSAIKEINKYMKSGVQPSLNLSDIEKFKVVVPRIEEQKKIASMLSKVDEKIEIYENKKEKLEELKKGLMQQLLTGKVRV